MGYLGSEFLLQLEKRKEHSNSSCLAICIFLASSWAASFLIIAKRELKMLF